ncbi:MAG TPA: selenide, water dikinase SelD [Streptosporangiaceae bacterium]
MAAPATQLPRLTSLSPGAGCACKLPLAKLEELFSSLGDVAPASGDLLVGALEGDDAAVLRLDGDRALVLTTDFFTPIVDDPADWGRIAAVNAMSDVYAMGGRPLIAVNLAAWPADGLPLTILAEVLRGAAAVAGEAGCIVAGGHTIDDPVPKYGMAVVGMADPARLMTIDRATPGDHLILTKPLGTGIVTTALKRAGAAAVGQSSAAAAAVGQSSAAAVGPGQSSTEDASSLDSALQAAVASMTSLNASASEAALAAGVRAATDVTGFGLLGHLHRMLAASGAAAEVVADRVPMLPGAEDLTRQGFVSGGTRANLDRLRSAVAVDEGIPEEVVVLLHDAQTSGGLLLAAEASTVDSLLEDLAGRGLHAAEVGQVVEGPAGRITVKTA